MTLNSGRTYSHPKFKTGGHAHLPPRIRKKGLDRKQHVRKHEVLKNLDLKKIRNEIIYEDENMLVNDHKLTRRLRNELKKALYTKPVDTLDTEASEDPTLNEARTKLKTQKMLKKKLHERMEFDKLRKAKLINYDRKFRFRIADKKWLAEGASPYDEDDDSTIMIEDTSPEN